MIDDNLKYIKQCNDMGIMTITFDNNYDQSYYPEELKNYESPLNQFASCWSETYEIINELSKESIGEQEND